MRKVAVIKGHIQSGAPPLHFAVILKHTHTCGHDSPYAFHGIHVWCEASTMGALEVTTEDKVPQVACGTVRGTVHKNTLQLMSSSQSDSFKG